MKTIDVKFFVIGIGAIFMLFFNTLFTYQNIEKLYDNTGWVVHTREVIGHINNITAAITTAESSQRGFILTNDPSYLIRFNDAPRFIKEEVAALEKMVKDNPQQVLRVQAFNNLVARRLTVMDENFLLMKEGGIEAARKGITNGQGKKRMDELYAYANEMIEDEKKLLNERTKRFEETHYLTLFGSAMTNTVCVVMLLAFIILLRRHLITRNKAEAVLFEERELCRVTLDSIGDGVLTTTVDGKVTGLNAVAKAMTGWTQEEAFGQPMQKVFHIINEYTRGPVDNPLEVALKKGTIVQLANHTILITKDGKELAIEDSAAPIRDKEGNIIGGVLVFRDVSSQKRAEDEYRRLGAVIQTSQDAVITKDLNGIITSWNKSAEKLFGYEAAEAIGKPVLMLIPQDRQNEEVEILKNIREGKLMEHYETIRQRKDGSLVEISLTISPIKDGHGTVIGASKIARDITRQREMEKDLREREIQARKLLEELASSNKELEQFAYVASHDLKGPIHTISSFADLLMRRAGDKLDKKDKEYVEAIKQAAMQGKTLIKELLEFSKIGKTQVYQTVEVNIVIEKVMLNLEVVINDSGAKIDITQPMPPIKATAVEVGQLFQNMIENAIKYRDANRIPHIIIDAVQDTEKMWRFSVQDNGIGIDPEYKERIFGIFERLHSAAEYPGAGIGLAICKKIVDHYGGKIWVESELNKGATFFFTLPGA